MSVKGKQIDLWRALRFQQKRREQYPMLGWSYVHHLPVNKQPARPKKPEFHAPVARQPAAFLLEECSVALEASTSAPVAQVPRPTTT